MLTIEKDETAYWYLTLTEKVTISSPTFLFNLTNRTTNTKYNFIMADVSSYPERYNQFQFIEGTTADIYTGEYEYKVYAQTSDSNLDPSLADELVEQGMLKCTEGTTTTSYTPTLNEKIYGE